MANLKRFTQGYTTGGTVPNICVQRDSDAFFLNGSGAFVANGGVPLLNAMSEKYAGFWEYETSAEVWQAGTINVTVYDSPSSAGAVLSAYSMLVSGDTLIGFVEASSTTSKNTVSALRTDIQAAQESLVSMFTKLGVLSDRIDSLNQILSRRDYNGTTTE